MSDNRERIPGLDVWKVLLMLCGPFVHAVDWEPEASLGLIITVSHSFRMGCFFLVSGVLTGRAIAKRSIGPWISHRCFQLGIPTAFALLLICPLTLAATRLVPKGISPYDTDRVGIYHLWFLIALIVYIPLTLVSQSERWFWFTQKLSDRSKQATWMQAKVLVSVSFSSFLLMLVSDTVVRDFLPPTARFVAEQVQLRLIVGYMPIYLLGLTMAGSRQFRDAMLAKLTVPLLFVAVLFGAAILRSFDYMAGMSVVSVELVRTFAASFGPPAIGIFILRSAMKIQQVPKLFQSLSTASFTIYLVHFPILAALKAALLPLSLSSNTEYGIMVLVSLGLSYALHYFIISRSPVLLLLLNGRSLGSFNKPVPVVAGIEK